MSYPQRYPQGYPQGKWCIIGKLSTGLYTGSKKLSTGRAHKKREHPRARHNGRGGARRVWCALRRSLTSKQETGQETENPAQPGGRAPPV